MRSSEIAIGFLRHEFRERGSLICRLQLPLHWRVSPCLFLTGVVAVCQCNPSGATVGRHSCDTVLPSCAAVYPLSRATRRQLRPKALLSVDILHAPRMSWTSRKTETLVPTARDIFWPSYYPAYANSDRRFCHHRTRGYAQALFLPTSDTFQPRFRPVAPDGQPPLAFVLDMANFVGAASIPIGLIGLGSTLTCAGRDVLLGRDHGAGADEDDRHAADWSWDHAMVRASWFRGPQREGFAVCMHVRVSPALLI